MTTHEIEQLRGRVDWLERELARKGNVISAQADLIATAGIALRACRDRCACGSTLRCDACRPAALALALSSL